MGRRLTRAVRGGLATVLFVGVVVVVSAAPASAAPSDVFNATDFHNAFNDGSVSEIVLHANIDIGCDTLATRNSSTGLSIDGQGFVLTQTCDGNPVLVAQGSGSLSLSDMQVTGGSAGGVQIENSLTATRVWFHDNTGDATIEDAFMHPISLLQSQITGGTYAIMTPGTVTLTQSTIADNHVTQAIGSEAVLLAGTGMSLTNSTVTNNSAPQGAIYASIGSVSLAFSTVVDNTVTGNCQAGASFRGPIPQVACQVNEGANVNTGESASLVSRSSVIALPHGGPNCSIDGSTSSGGFNWTDDDSCGLGGGTGDVEDDGGNPQLGALGNNGGLTLTRLPGPGSPLIDQIPHGTFPCSLAAAGIRFAPFALVDQRGVSRPQGSACDVGAVEVVPGNPNELPSVTVMASPNTTVEGGAVPGKFTFTRQGDTSFDMGVAYNVSGTATSGTDYTALPPVVIPAGQSSASIDVDALADNVADPNETVTLQITMGPDYTIGSPSSATMTILEDFCASAPQADYPDRETFDVHAHAIDCITAYGMAEGFDDGTYGATLPLGRAQMASFIARMLKDAGVTLPTNPPDAYPGDDGDVHELAINQLAALGVLDETTGQTGDKYNVSDPMRRDDMAQLLYNAYKVIVGEALPDGPNAFTDDNTSDNEQAINALANAGVVEGTGGGLYDPSGPVSRGQMASFFERLMQILVDAGKFPATPPA